VHFGGASKYWDIFHSLKSRSAILVKKDLTELLHEIRSRCLSELPPAERILSLGSSGKWFFEWFGSFYPHKVIRHVGVDMDPAPPGLPAEVTWQQADVAFFNYPAEEFDLVFAGQVIEHLWPEEHWALLLGANKALHSGGYLVVDSPNLTVTRDYFWNNPEHTTEYSLDQMKTLLTLGGFSVGRVRGLLLCRNSLGELMPIPGLLGTPAGLEPLDLEERARNGVDQPELSFLWWIESIKRSPPQFSELREKIDLIFKLNYDERLRRVIPGIGKHDLSAHVTRVGPWDRPGFIFYGPYARMRKGMWLCTYTLSSSRFEYDEDPGQIALSLDVCRIIPPFYPFNPVRTILAKRSFTVGDLQRRRHLQVEFETDGAQHEAFEFRLYYHGIGSFDVCSVPEIELKS
jgi:hypothetical protein